MRAATIGKTQALAGELLTLYADQDDHGTPGDFKTLYILKDFNFSEELAKYQQRLIEENRLLKTGETVTSFTEHLIQAGFGREPEATLICLGVKDRMPERAMSEYKHFARKENCVIDELNGAFSRYSISIVTVAQCYVLMGRGLMSPPGSGPTLSAEIWHDGEFSGMLILDVIGDFADFKIADVDKEQIVREIVRLSSEEGGLDVTVKSVFFNSN